MSGATLLRPSQTPLQPEVAGRYGFNKLIFYDDFNDYSTIDMGNTAVAGFNWYLKRRWPLMTENNNWVGVRTDPAFPPQYITVAGSVLSLTSDTPYTGPIPYTGVGSFGVTTGLCIQSAASSGASYVGTVFTPPFYVETRMKFTSSLANFGSYSWPAFWTVDMRALLGTTLLYTDTGFYEHLPNGAGDAGLLYATHDWDLGNLANPYISNPNLADNSWVQGGVNLLGQNTFFVYGTLCLTQAYTGNYGALYRFINGRQENWNDQTDLQYKAGANSIPSAGVLGAFSGFDAGQHVLNLSCGNNWPMDIDYVAVWIP